MEKNKTAMEKSKTAMEKGKTVVEKSKTAFISFGNVAIFFSLAIIIAGAVGVYLLGGLNLGIDFESGVSLQVQFTQDDTPPSTEEVRAALAEFGAVSVQQVTDTNGRYLIKSNLGGEGNDAIVNTLQERLRTEFGAELEVLEVAFIGPRYSTSIARQSIILTLSALVLILLYIWMRFRLRYSISAIVALVHDVLMTIVFIGIARIELSTTTVAAILTIIGYSLNDTVVIFDRIRENNDIYKRDVPFAEIANVSIRQSLSRTLITSLTTLLAVIAIYVFSTGSIQDFALCMIFGVVVGTYSSICIASPVLVTWAKRSPRGAVRLKKQKHDSGTGTAEKAMISDKREKNKEITVNTERIRQELIARRKQQQHKKKKR